MSNRVYTALLLSLLSISTLASIDSTLIEHFESMGADFSAPSRISFIFRVPENEQSKMESRLRRHGYQVQSKPSHHDLRMLSASITIQVTGEALSKYRQKFTALAFEFGAIYDGWGVGFQAESLNAQSKED